VLSYSFSYYPVIAGTCYRTIIENAFSYSRMCSLTSSLTILSFQACQRDPPGDAGVQESMQRGALVPKGQGQSLFLPQTLPQSEIQRPGGGRLPPAQSAPEEESSSVTAQGTSSGEAPLEANQSLVAHYRSVSGSLARGIGLGYARCGLSAYTHTYTRIRIRIRIHRHIRIHIHIHAWDILGVA